MFLSDKHRKQEILHRRALNIVKLKERQRRHFSIKHIDMWIRGLFDPRCLIFYVIINVLFDNYLYICSRNPKHVRIMTTLAQRISETPMAPYAALLRGMTREQKRIVVTYLTESMEEPAVEAKSNAEIIREKFKGLKISPELKKLRGCIKLTEEDLKDERTQYILNR